MPLVLGPVAGPAAAALDGNGNIAAGVLAGSSVHHDHPRQPSSEAIQAEQEEEEEEEAALLAGAGIGRGVRLSGSWSGPGPLLSSGARQAALQQLKLYQNAWRWSRADS
eukprot:gene4309-4562_t